jgi:adenosylmethionine-8-amino-7-oxononanoate aminotransferase
MPPLTTTANEIDRIVSALAEALNECCAVMVDQ